MAKKILIIEDDEVTRHMFQSMLNGAGFEVEAAENGEVGLKKAVSFNPDLIMLDILMPVMDGHQVLKQLKTGDEERDIPVIVLTSIDQAKEEELARVLGADEFLSKDNVHLELIIEKVNNLLKKKGLGRSIV